MPYAQLDGTDIYYEDQGADTGQALLFLHGWGTSGRVWEAQVADLGRDHRVVTMDWRGCGRSAHPAEGNTTAGNTADILALIDMLGLNRPVLVGSSMGATFALEAALAAPQRVLAVVSVDGPGHWAREGMTEVIRGLLDGFASDRAATVAEWVPTWFGPAAERETVDATIEQVLASGTAIDDLFREIIGDTPPRDLCETLPHLAVPALFVHGPLDAIPVAVSRTLAALAPQGELQVIEGAGHMPHQELPAEFNAVLRAAVGRMASAGV
ncbi:alpha/beta fold hydrolase [Actinomycetota bacterium Odt1-20B]